MVGGKYVIPIYRFVHNLVCCILDDPVIYLNVVFYLASVCESAAE
jgi:hypothetical protein